MAACTLTLASLAGGPVQAQTGFEGVITYLDHSKSDGKTTTMVQTTKGNKAKFEGLGGQQGAVIFDGDNHSMIMVQPEKKQYMTVTQADMDQWAAMVKPMAEKMQAAKREKGGEGKDDFKIDLSKTGRTETVAGTKCEVWRGTTVDEDGTKKEGEVCVAQGVGFAFFDIMMNNPMMQAQMQKFKQVLSGGKGVLKFTSIEGGKPFVQMEATKIDRRSVSDAELQPPAGYTGTSMGAMIQQSAQQMKLLQQRQQGQKPAQGKPKE
jgi:hypothetical protein